MIPAPWGPPDVGPVGLGLRQIWFRNGPTSRGGSGCVAGALVMAKKRSASAAEVLQQGAVIELAADERARDRVW